MIRLMRPPRRGLIPAHAGSTTTRCSWVACWRAHPRSRGEHQGLGAQEGNPPGSSPLTRGAHPSAQDVLKFHGLIPAHAGSTSQPARTQQNTGAHPRSRGEHAVSGRSCLLLEGSSPLTRGARLAHRVGHAPLGLIPAHAGSTGCRGPHQSRRTAHPRSRGEHAKSQKPTKIQIGLIPAHAGSTPVPVPGLRRCTAHPRSRGEHEQGKELPKEFQGSSPLTRGAPPRGTRTPGRPGLIPAHAGSTLRFRATAEKGGAHPRSRGEHPGM